MRMQLHGEVGSSWHGAPGWQRPTSAASGLRVNTVGKQAGLGTKVCAEYLSVHGQAPWVNVAPNQGRAARNLQKDQQAVQLVHRRNVLGL
jgi:hypothetical protein